MYTYKGIPTTAGSSIPTLPRVCGLSVALLHNLQYITYYIAPILYKSQYKGSLTTIVFPESQFRTQFNCMYAA